MSSVYALGCEKAARDFGVSPAAERLAKALSSLPSKKTVNEGTKQNPLDRVTRWGKPSSLYAGSTSTYDFSGMRADGAAI